MDTGAGCRKTLLCVLQVAFQGDLLPLEKSQLLVRSDACSEGVKVSDGQGWRAWVGSEGVLKAAPGITLGRRREEDAGVSSHASVHA